MKKEAKLIKNVELASKIVLKEDEQLFKNLNQKDTKQDNEVLVAKTSNSLAHPSETCALMGCDLEDGTPTLKEIAEGKECQGKHQAQMLIDDFGFEPDDKLCDSCFWK